MRVFNRRIYLDYASAAPVRRSAARAFARAVPVFGNPSSVHEEGRAAKGILEAARTNIARLTEVKPDDVIFTSGATEANNLAIRGLARERSHMLYAPTMHASVVETMHALRYSGVITEELKIKNGRIDCEALNAQLRKETVLVCVDAVCGETGTVWNTREVKTAIGSVLLHVDASQAPLSQKITRSHFGADLLTLDAQKIGGVRGIGCLIAPRTIALHPIMTGGAQERGLRPGTESPALAASFAAALRETTGEREEFVKHAKEDRKALAAFITSSIPNVYINEGSETAPHILNISLVGRDTDYLVALLDEAGYALGTVSACESGQGEGSRAVRALTADDARAASTLRISWGPYTKRRELMRFASALMTSVRFVDKEG